MSIRDTVYYSSEPDPEAAEIKNRHKRKNIPLPRIIAAEFGKVFEIGNYVQVVQETGKHIQKIQNNNGSGDQYKWVVEKHKTDKCKIPDHPREGKGMIIGKLPYHKIGKEILCL